MAFLLFLTPLCVMGEMANYAKLRDSMITADQATSSPWETRLEAYNNFIAQGLKDLDKLTEPEKATLRLAYGRAITANYKLGNMEKAMELYSASFAVSSSGPAYNTTSNPSPSNSTSLSTEEITMIKDTAILAKDPETCTDGKINLWANDRSDSPCLANAFTRLLTFYKSKKDYAKINELCDKLLGYMDGGANFYGKTVRNMMSNKIWALWNQGKKDEAVKYYNDCLNDKILNPTLENHFDDYSVSNAIGNAAATEFYDKLKTLQLDKSLGKTTEKAPETTTPPVEEAKAPAATEQKTATTFDEALKIYEKDPSWANLDNLINNWIPEDDPTTATDRLAKIRDSIDASSLEEQEKYLELGRTWNLEGTILEKAGLLDRASQAYEAAAGAYLNANDKQSAEAMLAKNAKCKKADNTVAEEPAEESTEEPPAEPAVEPTEDETTADGPVYDLNEDGEVTMADYDLAKKWFIEQGIISENGLWAGKIIDSIKEPSARKYNYKSKGLLGADDNVSKRDLDAFLEYINSNERDVRTGVTAKKEAAKTAKTEPAATTETEDPSDTTAAASPNTNEDTGGTTAATSPNTNEDTDGTKTATTKKTADTSGDTKAPADSEKPKTAETTETTKTETKSTGRFANCSKGIPAGGHLGKGPWSCGCK